MPTSTVQWEALVASWVLVVLVLVKRYETGAEIENGDLVMKLGTEEMVWWTKIEE